MLDCPPQRFLMVGNSIRSDIMPVVELGARAVHVPYHLVWEHEHVGSWAGHGNVVELAALSELPALLTACGPAVNDLHAQALRWISDDPDPRTRTELSRLIARKEWDEVADRFDGRLEFGTAGLRGALGAGPNRMNRAVVTRAAAGLAAYLLGSRRRPRWWSASTRATTRTCSPIDTVEVMRGAGLDAVLLPRPVPTPVLAYGILRLGCVAGVMVTASHNPAADNGYKVYLGDGGQIVPPADAEISAAIDAVGLLADVPRGKGWQVAGDERGRGLRRSRRRPVADARRVTCASPTRRCTGSGGEALLRVVRGRRLPRAARRRRAGRARSRVPDRGVPQPRGAGRDGPRARPRRASGADLVIANDPDADRCARRGRRPGAARRRARGAARRPRAAPHQRRRPARWPRRSCPRRCCGRLAAAHGVHYAETLTGFKWIVKADVPGARFVFGYEEALGYCIGAVRGPASSATRTASARRWRPPSWPPR